MMQCPFKYFELPSFKPVVAATAAAAGALQSRKSRLTFEGNRTKIFLSFIFQEQKHQNLEMIAKFSNLVAFTRCAFMDWIRVGMILGLSSKTRAQSWTGTSRT